MLRAVLGLVGQRYLDVSLTTAPGLRSRIIERPGLWMEDAALDALVADLRRVARATLGEATLEYGVVTGDRDRLSGCVITLITRESDSGSGSDGVPVAFNALSILEVPLGRTPVQVLHLGLVMVDPANQSRGLAWALYGLTCFLLLVRGGLRPVWVSNVTQVPAVVGLVAENFSQVWPVPEGLPRGAARPARRSLTHLLLARQIMTAHRAAFGVGPKAGFDEARFVITDAYTGGSDALKKPLDQAAPHREPGYGAFCAAHLDYARGDDLLQIGQADLAAGMAFLRRRVPRGSLLGLILVALAATLQRAALPLWHWADSRTAFGILRARGGR